MRKENLLWNIGLYLFLFRFSWVSDCHNLTSADFTNLETNFGTVFKGNPNYLNITLFSDRSYFQVRKRNARFWAAQSSRVANLPVHTVSGDGLFDFHFLDGIVNSVYINPLSNEAVQFLQWSDTDTNMSRLIQILRDNFRQKSVEEDSLTVIIH